MTKIRVYAALLLLLAGGVLAWEWRGEPLAEHGKRLDRKHKVELRVVSQPAKVMNIKWRIGEDGDDSRDVTVGYWEEGRFASSGTLVKLDAEVTMGPITDRRLIRCAGYVDDQEVSVDESRTRESCTITFVVP